MPKVKVVTDTTACLPPALVAESGLEVISLSIVFPSGTAELESEITDLKAYWAKLANLSELPTTSQPSVGAFEECFGALAASGHDVVAVLISSEISGTVGAARLAADAVRERHPDRRIAICDSRSTGGGLGMIALATAAAARAGGDVDGVVQHTERAIAENKIWFAVETLEYLRRGGRIGGAQALLGGALQIKPILSIDGTIAPIERVRTSKRAFARLLAFADELVQTGRDGWIVQHIQAEAEAERLAAEVQRRIGHPPLFVSEVGPVVGTHVGPGMLGVGGIAPELLS